MIRARPKDRLRVPLLGSLFALKSDTESLNATRSVDCFVECLMALPAR